MQGKYSELNDQIALESYQTGNVEIQGHKEAAISSKQVTSTVVGQTGAQTSIGGSNAVVVQTIEEEEKKPAKEDEGEEIDMADLLNNY